MTPEALYRQLAALIAEMPDLETEEDYGEVEHRWLGKSLRSGRSLGTTIRCHSAQ
jgi:hypothetical protein